MITTHPGTGTVTVTVAFGGIWSCAAAPDNAPDTVTPSKSCRINVLSNQFLFTNTGGTTNHISSAPAESYPRGLAKNDPGELS